MKWLLALILCLAVLVAALPTIHAWERDNDYPFGKMCHSVFTGFVDTCSHQRQA
jgi:hypothetical protein